MLPRAALALLLLTGCRDAVDSADPGAPLAQPDAAAKGAPESTAEPGPSSEPSTPIASPTPAPPTDTPAKHETPAPTAPERFAAEASVDVGGRPIAVRIDEQAPADPDAVPTRTLLVSIDGVTQGDRLLSIPTSFQYCEQVEAVVEPVEGEPSPLVLAQAFCGRGEDEFSRDIVSAVVHVGDAATPPRVLWQGEGSFSSSFGVCQRADIPLAEVPRPGTLLIERLTEVVFDPDRDLPQIRCRAKKARTRKVEEIAF